MPACPLPLNVPRALRLLPLQSRWSSRLWRRLTSPASLTSAAAARCISNAAARDRRRSSSFRGRATAPPTGAKSSTLPTRPTTRTTMLWPGARATCTKASRRYSPQCPALRASAPMTAPASGSMDRTSQPRSPSRIRPTRRPTTSIGCSSPRANPAPTCSSPIPTEAWSPRSLRGPGPPKWTVSSWSMP